MTLIHTGTVRCGNRTEPACPGACWELTPTNTQLVGHVQQGAAGWCSGSALWSDLHMLLPSRPRVLEPVAFRRFLIRIMMASSSQFSFVRVPLSVGVRVVNKAVETERNNGSAWREAECGRDFSVSVAPRDDKNQIIKATRLSWRTSEWARVACVFWNGHTLPVESHSWVGIPLDASRPTIRRRPPQRSTAQRRRTARASARPSPVVNERIPA